MGITKRAVVATFLVCVLGAAACGGEPRAQDVKPVVVVFDFNSGYDAGRMGKFVAKNLWAKLDRLGRCVLIDREDLVGVVRRAKFAATFEGNPEGIVRFAAEEFGATHAVWGKVEQGQWATYTRDFRPHRTDHEGKFAPTVTRIELYAYWLDGIVYFDDVVLKKLR